MSASLSDILTAVKNIAANISTAASNYINVQGGQVRTGITTATVLNPTPGRVCTVSVVVAGSAVGAVYDANSTTNLGGKIWSIPDTVGLYVVNMPTNVGVTVVPGTGQTLAVSYS
jgi:hypothetical protein